MAFLWTKNDYIMVVAFVNALLIFQVIALIRFVDKTNRDLNSFLQSIKHADFSQTFDAKNYGASFEELEKSFNEVTNQFLKIRSEKEENVHYLQTVVQHIGTGLISYRPDGEVELINTAAKRLLQINHLKNIKSLEKISETLAPTLLDLKPGQNALLEVVLDGRTAFLSINATQFRIHQTTYTLVSLQDIRNEIERERMATELNIAYQVQKSLLPKSNPQIPGFEISGFCEPAKEIGGDYYDFIPLGKNKLAIVIADVSGKGVAAAIYMTLTKGFIQSHIDSNFSPREVLTKVNSLLYQTIDRKSFVSMFLAILDGESGTLTCARAGHNEAIFYSAAENRFMKIQPEGIGLGLEAGEIFQGTIREQKLVLKRGDLLVFYTDGFTEAMGKNSEIFEEIRLTNAIAEFKEQHTSDMIQSIYHRIQNFIGDRPQYDDMTMIAIKALP